LPNRIKIFIYRKAFKYRIGQNVTIGLSIISASIVELGDGVQVGHFNFVGGISEFIVGNGSYIKHFNHFSGVRDSNFVSKFLMGSDSKIISRHFFDISGKITIGDRSVISGRDTQLWSHTRIFDAQSAHLAPTCVAIGDDVYVGARCTLVGCNIPDRAVVGAGAVVTKDFSHVTNRVLIAGNPAVIKKTYSEV
jgi:acetyltransferase-like isoleucine patch superfamily enzyme